MDVVTLVTIVGTGVSIIGAVAGMGFLLWRLIVRDNDALRADIRDIRTDIGGLRGDVTGLRERMAQLEGLFEEFARRGPPDAQPGAAG